MENQTLQPVKQSPVEYADPTKAVIPPETKRRLSKGWIIFIGFNIAFPIIFALAYLLMR